MIYTQFSKDHRVMNLDDANHQVYLLENIIIIPETGELRKNLITPLGLCLNIALYTLTTVHQANHKTQTLPPSPAHVNLIETLEQIKFIIKYFPFNDIPSVANAIIQYFFDLNSANKRSFLINKVSLQILDLTMLSNIAYNITQTLEEAKAVERKVDTLKFISANEVERKSNSIKPEPNDWTSLDPNIFRNTGRSPRFHFPGAYHGLYCSDGRCCNQYVDVTIDPKEFSRPQAVLILVFDSQHKLLLVRHKVRGWELPGGKIMEGESPEDAAIRETVEESGILIHKEKIIPLAQYHLSNSDNSVSTDQKYHCKTVFLASVSAYSNLPNLETDARNFATVWPTKNNDIGSFLKKITYGDQYSVLLKDNVFSIMLTLAKNRLGLLCNE